MSVTFTFKTLSCSFVVDASPWVCRLAVQSVSDDAATCEMTRRMQQRMGKSWNSQTLAAATGTGEGIWAIVDDCKKQGIDS